MKSTRILIIITAILAPTALGQSGVSPTKFGLRGRSPVTATPADGLPAPCTANSPRNSPCSAGIQSCQAFGIGRQQCVEYCNKYNRDFDCQYSFGHTDCVCQAGTKPVDPNGPSGSCTSGSPHDQSCSIDHNGCWFPGASFNCKQHCKDLGRDSDCQYSLGWTDCVCKAKPPRPCSDNLPPNTTCLTPYGCWFASDRSECANYCQQRGNDFDCDRSFGSSECVCKSGTTPS